MSVDTRQIGAALELIIDAASQHAVDRVSAGRLALYGALAAALAAAEQRGAERERARITDALRGDVAVMDNHGMHQSARALEVCIETLASDALATEATWPPA